MAAGQCLWWDCPAVGLSARSIFMRLLCQPCPLVSKLSPRDNNDSCNQELRVACIRGDEWKVKIMLPRNRGGVASDIEGTRKALSERDIVNAINMKSEASVYAL